MEMKSKFFSELSTNELYKILKIRAEIFVVEQNCVYQDMDAVPDNIPALKLYKKSGFVYVGDADLDRGIDYIPTFSLLEMNF